MPGTFSFACPGPGSVRQSSTGCVADQRFALQRIDGASVCVHTCDLSFRRSDCDNHSVLNECNPLLNLIPDFVTALLSASIDPFDVCVFNGNASGLLDDLDAASFVGKLPARWAPWSAKHRP